MVLQDRAKVTREAIIAGAAAIFEEHGYGSASLTQVSETAGVTKGALYFHFQSKDDLAKAVIEEQHRVVVSQSQAIIRGNFRPLQTMILMCGAFGQSLVTRPIVRAGIRLTLEGTAFGHHIRGPYEDWISTMEKFAELGKTERQIRTDLDAGALANFLVASFTGVQMVSGVLTNRADVMRRIADMWTIILPGIMHEEYEEDARELVQLVFDVPEPL
ncbi:TetR/AcrR family transcriptional regulator [Pseudarthrobacter sp. RMG13]|uniref:TetR/AcrR family transcriptional regulator n=1 Tax=Pseudarthrobacter humi TaxID=2952523 RepID=A0ABT1LLY3_9MICC|nr:ScbR family autoregulator-binding transcription factor [Pseudarthrobacter humi]MCP8999460.1 TetR/AcrR family transcriptional regulator [Pseudarthrobacter humi]